MHFPGIALLVLALIVLMSVTSDVVVRVIRLKHVGGYLFYGYMWLAMLYTSGVALKFSEYGPSWLRWHLSDVGFPLVVGGAMWWRLRRRFKPERSWQPRTLVKMAWSRAACILAGLTLAITLEVIEGIAHVDLVAAGKQAGIGDFDWIDVYCYVGGTVVALALVLVPLWRYKRQPDELHRAFLLWVTAYSGGAPWQ